MVRLARNDHLAQGELLRIEPQSGHLFVCAVAAVTGRLKYRLHVSDEINSGLPRGGVRQPLPILIADGERDKRDDDCQRESSAFHLQPRSWVCNWCDRVY